CGMRAEDREWIGETAREQGVNASVEMRVFCRRGGAGLRGRSLLFFFSHGALLRSGRMRTMTEAGYSLPFSARGRTGNKGMMGELVKSRASEFCVPRPTRFPDSFSTRLHQSGIAGTIRLPDPVILTTKEDAQCDH